MTVERVVASGPDFRWVETSAVQPVEDETPTVWYSCPCCGYPTLRSRQEYEICVLCWWHDDTAIFESGEKPNFAPMDGPSLADGRANFARSLVIYAPGEQPDIEGSDLVKELKREAIALFDSIRDGTNTQDVSIVWYRAHNALENAELIRSGEADFE